MLSEYISCQYARSSLDHRNVNTNNDTRRQHCSPSATFRGLLGLPHAPVAGGYTTHMVSEVRHAECRFLLQRGWADMVLIVHQEAKTETGQTISRATSHPTCLRCKCMSCYVQRARCHQRFSVQYHWTSKLYPKTASYDIMS